MNTVGYLGALGASGTAQKLALTTSAAQSAVVGGTARPGAGVTILLALDTPSYVTSGANPTVATDGTSMYLTSGAMHRIEGLAATDKLSIAAVTGTGNAYIIPVV